MHISEIAEHTKNWRLVEQDNRVFIVDGEVKVAELTHINEAKLILEMARVIGEMQEGVS
jgi:hypothetical protein